MNAVPKRAVMHALPSHFGVPVDVEIDPKVISTLQARAALAGYELVALADGTFIVTRWGLLRGLDHVAAVEAFLKRVEAA